MISSWSWKKWSRLNYRRSLIPCLLSIFSSVKKWYVHLRVITNIRIFLGISMEKRKKNGASLPKRRKSTGCSWKYQGYSSLNPASAIFLLFSMDIPRNILGLARALNVSFENNWFLYLFLDGYIFFGNKLYQTFLSMEWLKDKGYFQGC